MSGSSLIVVVSALVLKRLKLPVPSAAPFFDGLLTACAGSVPDLARATTRLGCRRPFLYRIFTERLEHPYPKAEGLKQKPT